MSSAQAQQVAIADTRPILLACPWGLGNRLRAITAAVHRIRTAPSAEQRARALVVAWGPHVVLGPCLNRSWPYCAFSDLFEPLSHPQLRVNVSVLPFERGAELQAFVRRARGSFTVIPTCKDDVVLQRMPACEQAWLHERLYRPQPALRREAMTYVDAHGLRQCVGMHLRGTDHEKLMGSGFIRRLSAAFERRIPGADGCS